MEEGEWLKIRLGVANRVYPLTIRRSEEAGLRMAARRIDAMLKGLENAYEVQDHQDLLAMCALQLAGELETLQAPERIDETEAVRQVEALFDRVRASLPQ